MKNTLHIDRPYFQPRSLKAYLVAGLIVLAASLLQLLLGPLVAGLPFVVFFPAIIVVTFLCGSAAGAVSSLASVIIAWSFFLPPQITDQAILRTGLFAVGSLTVVVIIALMRVATRDVRQLYETLQVSEGKFRGLLESAPDAMIIVDEQRRITLMNAQAEMVFGYARTELLGDPVENLLAERSRDAYLPQLSSFMTNFGVPQTGDVIDLHAVRKDGTEFPIEVSFGHLNTKAGVLVSNAIRDITARRQIEAHLAEASKAKSDFLARVSHELRTPLNAIIGFSELIRDGVVAPLDQRYREYGGDINSAGRHLLTIINEILDISKIEDGQLELREESVSIADVVEECRRIVAVMAEATGVFLTIEAPKTLPRLRADKIRLRQILLNVMSNAVKFTPAAGHVSVSASIQGDGVELVVRDTGIGMRPEDIPIALEPFRQIDGTLSRRFEGTGLGLPLAKALVDLHGGSLEIQSALAKGTTVRIHLPKERIEYATT